MCKKCIVFLVTISICFFVTACDQNDKDKTNVEKDVQQKEEEIDTKNQDDSKVENNEKETEQITLSEIQSIPTDIEGLANQPPGPLANAKDIYEMEDEVKDNLDKLGPMSENPDDEEYEKYSRYMYWLVAEDYPNPEDIIKKWEFASFGDPDLPDAKFHFKENYNIEIILDSSGSMANTAGNGTRMDVAKNSINSFLSEIPEEANVSLRVYGHKGTGSDSDKEMSCSAIEQVYGFDSFDEGKFQDALDQFQPKGWTPLADALKQSQEALKEFDSENNTNLIYVVSDGIETCDGDPVKVAKSLSDSNAQPIINIIGFQTDAEAQKQLEEMAEVSGGIFTSAKNEEELQKEFDRAEEVLNAWNKWKNDAMEDLESKEVDSNTDIMEMHNVWSTTTTSIKNHFHSLADVAQNVGILTYEQKKELKSRLDPVTEDINSSVDQLEIDLEELRDANFKEAKQAIEEKYNKQSEE
ncbi:VWA domain-containing protein [Lentibacillus salicampi]|nr:VWA domain-containing protein [Lentibacillus salicampi]